MVFTHAVLASRGFPCIRSPNHFHSPSTYRTCLECHLFCSLYMCLARWGGRHRDVVSFVPETGCQAWHGPVKPTDIRKSSPCRVVCKTRMLPFFLAPCSVVYATKFLDHNLVYRSPFHGLLEVASSPRQPTGRATKHLGEAASFHDGHYPTCYGGDFSNVRATTRGNFPRAHGIAQSPFIWTGGVTFAHSGE
jgi:hypothetical protein